MSLFTTSEKQEEYLDFETNKPTSNDHYFKQIVTHIYANQDTSWYPYLYQDINCKCCHKYLGYKVKKWFGFIYPSDARYNTCICSDCRKDLVCGVILKTLTGVKKLHFDDSRGIKFSTNTFDNNSENTDFKTTVNNLDDN